ncbi:MAG: HAD-IA family hydrolase [Theionarchaea archaeon]|nr:HAD-IA family hydrolase [Theionarchaea archaeon]
MIRAVLFDFDYTLADTSRGVIECVRVALEEMGLPAVSAERVRETIGMSLRETFRHVSEEGNEERSNEFERLFLKRADEVMADLAVMYERARESVQQLRDQFLLGIVSTKFRYRIQTILKREKMLSAFNVVIGGEDVIHHKPHPEALLKAVDLLGCSPDEVIYVGDSTVDAEAARRASIRFVAVLSGVTGREEFRGHECVGIIEDIGGLPEFLQRVP